MTLRVGSINRPEMRWMSDLIEVKDLTVLFPVKRELFKPKKFVRAVHHVNLNIKRGSIVGLAGESGSGKSTTGKAILHLVKPTSGDVLIDGCSIFCSNYDAKELRKNNQIIFQDSFSSLNPQKTIRQSLETPMKIHHIGKTEQERNGILEKTLKDVGLSGDVLTKYPHEFSGGQLQRICIARALLLQPSFIVCDEAIAALDVSIQSQIINLFRQLKEKYHLTYLFISHNLSVLKYLCDEIGIMYLGKIVEYAPAAELFANPQHPYTKALLSVIPVPDPKIQGVYASENIIEGEIPSPIAPPPGCAFSTRCPFVCEQCKSQEPERVFVSEDHYVACHCVKRSNE